MTDIERREKVIRGLECCARNKYKDVCPECDYFSDCLGEGGMAARLAHEALKIIKVQEPTNVVERPREFVCPKCGLRLAGRSTDDCVLLETDETPNFCWRCGQAVKWE